MILSGERPLFLICAIGVAVIVVALCRGGIRRHYERDDPPKTYTKRSHLE